MIVTTPESMLQTAMVEFLKAMQDVDTIMYFSNMNAYDMRKLCYFASYLSDMYGHPYSDMISEFMSYVAGDFYGYMRPLKRRRFV